MTSSTLLSRVDGNPEPRYLPSLIADKVAGLHAAYGTLAALLHRERSGEGQLVEVPMFEAFTGFMLLEHLSGLTFDPPNAPVGYFRQIDPDRQPFPCSDGHVSIVAYTDGAWEKIFNLLGDPRITITASDIQKVRNERPDKRPHSITRSKVQKILANRAASTKEGWMRVASPPPLSNCKI